MHQVVMWSVTAAQMLALILISCLIVIGKGAGTPTRKLSDM